MAQFAVPLMVAGAVVKGVGGLAAGAQNKRVLFEQARAEQMQGAAEELRIRDAARQAMGEQVAGQFSNGFEGGTGSALDALTQSQINATLDALTVRRDAASRAKSLRAQGRQAMTGAMFGAASDIIGAGSSVIGAKADWAAAKQGRSG